MFYVQLVVAGIATGCVYSLSAMGLVLTYKATGVFNFAHSGIALLVAYVLWQMNAGWGWSLAVAAPLALLVVGPGIGLVLERLVFRPLQQARASTSEKLVATLGVLTLCLGVVFQVWTSEVKGDVPRLIPDNPVELPGGIQASTEQLGRLALVLAISAALWALFRYTHLGTQIRAVVDRRELSELAAVNSGRVSAVAWALGTGLAGLTGVLLAPPALEPTRLVLLVIETFSIALVARLVSLPVAVGAGILIMGVGSSLLSQVHVFGSRGLLGGAVEQLKPNLSVVVLFVALVVYRRLDEVGEAPAGATRGLAMGLARRGRAGVSRANRWAAAGVVAAAALLPFALDDVDLVYGQRMLALAVVFVSIVCVTGFSGHITLGQAAFAGLGAFFTARAANAWGLPVLAAMPVGGLVALAAGLVAGWPALRRRGLFLGLTTLSLGLLVYQFVFNSELFKGGPGGMVVDRPSLFGWSLAGPHAFYWFELVVLALVLVLARNLRSGRLGRILAAMRDSETASRSVGIDLRTYKLFIFAASAFIAGIGGSLLAQTNNAFEAVTFHPLESLFWFTVVVVAGLGSLGGAALGAFIYVLLPIVLGIDAEASRGILGFAALFLGRLPGGLVGAARQAAGWVRNPGAVRAAYRWAEAQEQAEAAAAADGRPALEPSPFAQRVLADAAEARR